jgi:prepilin-type N-terminal cleavage/methylation domain-containing protein/prepilin-type processing-associated H-X9-DG protein
MHRVLQPHRAARGFTLVELLVVIAIIGMLVGLLLPGVQAARESSRRSQCSSNIRQLAVAVQSRISAHKAFPWGRNSVSLSTHVLLLPFIEQTEVFAKIDQSKPWNDPFHASVAAQAIPTLRCPSDPAAAVPPTFGGTNFRFNQGAGILWGNPPTSSSDPNFGMPAPNGIFFLDSAVQVKDVIDGLSTTAAISEHGIGDFDNNRSSRTDTFAPATTPATPAIAFQDCEAIDATNLAYQRFSNVGAPWLYGYHSTTLYFHVAPPNRRSCMYPPGRIMTTAKSSHSGGVNLAMCDASVRFVADSVDLAVWQAIGTRSGGEVVADAGIR